MFHAPAAGYFAFMAVESLPGSQFWDRTLLLATDPARRAALLERGHAPYLGAQAFRGGAAGSGSAVCMPSGQALGGWLAGQSALGRNAWPLRSTVPLPTHSPSPPTSRP